MKSFASVLFGLIAPLLCTAQNRYEISLLTCSPGKETYAAFGHTALKVTDTADSTATVYNFGLFDFSTPHFYVKFAKGDLLYRLGKQSPERFASFYLSENRSITEQRLRLSEEQSQALVDRLEYLYLPENREYLYRFINRNCTTEPRDIIFDVTGIPKPETADRHTNRHYLNRCLASKPMARLGINIILGSYIDKPLTAYRSMFLPELLSERIGSAENMGKSLVAATEIYGSDYGRSPNGWLVWVMYAVLVASALLVAWDDSGRTAKVLFAAAGAVGIVLAMLALFSEHPEVQKNYNLLWANPVYLLFPFFGKKRLRSVQTALYAGAILSILALYAVWILKVQGWTVPLLMITLVLLAALVKRICLLYPARASSRGQV